MVDYNTPQPADRDNDAAALRAALTQLTTLLSTEPVNTAKARATAHIAQALTGTPDAHTSDCRADALADILGAITDISAAGCTLTLTAKSTIPAINICGHDAITCALAHTGLGLLAGGNNVDLTVEQTSQSDVRFSFAFTPNANQTGAPAGTASHLAQAETCVGSNAGSWERRRDGNGLVTIAFTLPHPSAQTAATADAATDNSQASEDDDALGALLAGMNGTDAPHGAPDDIHPQATMPAPDAPTQHDEPNTGPDEDDGEDDEPLRILAAEDHPNNRDVLDALLEPFGVDLTFAHDGRQAVDAWKAKEFDIILMDIQMPELSGIDAAKEIRRLEKETGRNRIPIVAVTANVMRHQIEEYFATGMDDCVGKPVDLSALLQAIEETLAGASKATNQAA